MRTIPLITVAKQAKEISANSSLLKPLAHEAANQAKNILKGAGLAYLRPKAFVINSKKASEEELAYSGGGTEVYDYKSSLFGLPVWDTVKLIANPYTTLDGKPAGKSEIKFEVALCQINLDKNIVKTSVAGRNGTWKELMNDGDFTISINAILAGDNSNLHPSSALITSLYNVITAPVTLEVESNFIGYFNIFSVVVDTFEVKQREGERNIFDVKLNLISDIAQDLDA